MKYKGNKHLKDRVWMLNIIIDYKKKIHHLSGKRKKSLKLAFLPNQLGETLKAEERNNTLHKGVRAYGYPEYKIWDIKVASKK